MKTTQTWKIGDCMEFLPEMPAKSVHLNITDIPYGSVDIKNNSIRNYDKGDANAITFNLEDFLKETVRITKGSIYIFCGTEQLGYIRHYFNNNGLTTRLCIWEKTNPSPMNGEYMWLSGIECCVYGRFPKATFNEHCKNSVWRYPIVPNQIHETQKPLELIKYLVKVSSNEGDMVHDYCMGSGTTLQACKATNRNFTGFEIRNNWEERYKSIVSQHTMFDY